MPKEKSRLELAMEELLGKGKSSRCSQESTGEQVESHEEKVDKEIYRLCNEAPIRLMEDPLEWWKENEKSHPLVRNLAARVLAATLPSKGQTTVNVS